MKVLVVGNILVEQDSLPVKLLPLLKKEFPKKDFPNIEFIEYDPSEDLPKGDLIIIDTIINTEDIIVFDDLERIELNKVYSLHDFDLGYNLKLMKKFGMLGKVKIIGVPEKMENEEDKILKLITLLKGLF